jgi:hypothetical protein
LAFQVSLCPAPSIGAAAGKKRADCLSPAESGVSFRALRPRRRRAGLSGTRAFSFASVFFHVKENEETIYGSAPRIGKTFPGLPPEVDGLNQN